MKTIVCYFTIHWCLVEDIVHKVHSQGMNFKKKYLRYPLKAKSIRIRAILNSPTVEAELIT